MQELLKGKKGVILGVANDRSIAWAVAQECARQGAQLSFNFLGAAQEKRVRDLVQNLPGSQIVACDVGKDNEIAQFFNEITNGGKEKIDFILHSVAFAEKDDLKKPFVETPRQNFSLALDISAYSLVAVAKHALEVLNNPASIVSMSYYGAEKVVPHYNVMGVAKAALETTTQYLAADLGPRGVRVNCVSAGPIRTLSSSVIPGIREMIDATQKFAPLRRNITGDDIAKSTVYLLSDLASGVTGEVLHVDSGYHVLGMFKDMGE